MYLMTFRKILQRTNVFADKDKRRPVIGMSVAWVADQGPLCSCQGLRPIAIPQVPVQPVHEGQSGAIIYLPQAGQHRVAACFQEGSVESNKFVASGHFREISATKCGITGTQSH